MYITNLDIINSSYSIQFLYYRIEHEIQEIKKSFDAQTNYMQGITKIILTIIIK